MVYSRETTSLRAERLAVPLPLVLVLVDMVELWTASRSSIRRSH